MKELWNDKWQFSKISIQNETQAREGTPHLFEPDDFYGTAVEFSCVEVPHDWLIEDAANLYENSVGFYKKDFSLADISEKRFFLHFNGVYMNWAVWVNGKKACTWKYGYTSVEFEITPFVTEGKNTVELIAVYQSPNSRWYSGAGIFRDVYFVTTPKTRIAPSGIYFVATLQDKDNARGDMWEIQVESEVWGPADGVSVVHTLVLQDKTEVPLSRLEKHAVYQKSISNPAPEMGECFDKEAAVLLDTQRAFIQAPHVWSAGVPYVYTLKTVLMDGSGATLDCVEQQVGFRMVRFDKDRGFFINGQNVKLNGVCEHHDFGALGAAFHEPSLRRKFLKLKDMGVNAIRTSHNPQDPAFLNLADTMGFFIVSEGFDMWQKPKTTYDYGNYFDDWHKRDTLSWVREGRNHPSLIMWSIGNEIYDTYSGNGYEITKDLRDIVRSADPQKNGAVTIGSNYIEWEGAQHCAQEIDTVGYNYAERLYKKHHTELFPEWCIYGSETASTVQSRGIYHFPYSNRVLTYSDNQCSSLGNCSTNWGAKDSAFVVTTERDTPYSAGQFIWTGFDYIGEPTPYFTKNSFFGQIDTAGFEKDSFFVYKSVWNNDAKPFVHILPYWDFNEGQLVDIRVYSNLPTIELFVNGESLGRKEIDFVQGDSLAATWPLVPYKKGFVEAVGYTKDGKVVVRERKSSFSESAALVLSVEEASCDNTYFIDISSVDKDNNPVENARSRVFVSVEGEAELIGLDNGDSTDYEQYKPQNRKSLSRKLFSNRLLAIVRAQKSNAHFTLTAESPSLSSAQLIFANGTVQFKNEGVPSSEAAQKSAQYTEIPVRKIELLCAQERNLGPTCREVVVTAVVHPKNASCKDIVFTPMMLEGVRSDCASVTVQDDGEQKRAVIKAESDGAFRLTATATNGSPYTEIVSELEFSVSGIGRATRNPYTLIEACKCSQSLLPVELSFNGGVFTKNERTWFSFDKVDFGNDGADSFQIPIFSFDTDLDFELWDGIPEAAGATKLGRFHYSSPSVYNTYQANVHTLKRRLFGVHTISIVFFSGLSAQGIAFIPSPKAFSRLNATDCTSVIGDTFTKQEDAICGIGNNVVLDFENMDFGETAASKIAICGHSLVDNTIHIKFAGPNGNTNCIVDFPKNEGFEEKTFSVHGLAGKTKVSFVFLPGSNFDFKSFCFIK